MTDVSFKELFLKSFLKLKTYSNGYIKMFTPMASLDIKPDGQNHITKSQAYLNGMYYYLCYILKISSVNDNNNLRMYLQRGHGLMSGYIIDNGAVTPSKEHCEAAHLSSITLAVMHSHDDDIMQEFEYAINAIVANDYSLKDDIEHTYSSYKFSKNAIHLLAALSLIKTSGFIKTKNKLMYKYLGCLSSLWLTKPWDYISASILAQKSKGLERYYWHLVLSFNWVLSRSSTKYNGFIIKLVEDGCDVRIRDWVKKKSLATLANRQKTYLGLALELASLNIDKCRDYLKPLGAKL